MTVDMVSGVLGVTAASVALVLGIFGWGKQPEEDTVLDKEEVAATLRLGLDDLCDADRRSGGWSRVDPQIAIEDVVLAAQIEQALRR